MASCSELYDKFKQSKQQVGSFIQSHEEELKPGQMRSVKISQYFERYQKFFESIMDRDVYKFMEERSSALSKQKITYNSSEFAQEMTILFISHTEDWQMVNMLVSLSYFTFEVTLLNSSSASPFSNEFQPIGQGAMGQIFAALMKDGTQFIIKSIKYVQREQDDAPRDEKENFRIQRSLGQAIKEYCINKLCSALEIGPRVLTQFGFDLIIFRKTVEFTIEHCQSIQQFRFEDFAWHLKVLHSLHIIHGDIKLENIMWSKTLKKPVLIDFGLSNVVKEVIGEESFTHYFGTYSHCLPEMKDLLLKKSFGYVDFYYNDVHGLLRSQDDKLFMVWSKPFDQIESNQEIEQRILNFQLMRLIFDNSIKEVEQFCNRNPKLCILEETIELFELFHSSCILFRILCLLEQRYLITHPKASIYRNYHNGMVLQIRKAETIEKENFQKRLKENITDGPMAITGIMLYLLLIYDQDVTPRAKYRKEQLGRLLRAATKVDKDFAWLLVEYCSNLFTTKQELLNMFEHVRQLLGLKNWTLVRDENNLYQKAVDIAKHFNIIYSINLYALNTQVQIHAGEINYHNFISKMDSYVAYLLNWITTYQPVIHPFTLNSKQHILLRLSYFRDLQSTKMLILKMIQINNSQNIDECSFQFGQSKFLTECSKFEAATKTIPYQASIQVRLKELELNSRFELRALRTKLKYEKWINLCFDIQTAIYFYFEVYVKDLLWRDQPNMEEVTEGIKEGFRLAESFLSTLTFLAFMRSLQSVISYMKIYGNGRSWVNEIVRCIRSNSYNLICSIVNSEMTSELEHFILIIKCCKTFVGHMSKDELAQQKSSLKAVCDCLHLIGSTLTINNVLYIMARTNLLFQINEITLKQMLQIYKSIAFSYQNPQKHLELSPLSYNDVFVKFKFYCQYLLALMNLNQDGDKQAAILESIIYNFDKDIMLKQAKNVLFCPTLAMFYASDVEKYFERGFIFLKFFLKSEPEEQYGFTMYIFLRNTIWPYIIDGQIPAVIILYMKHFMITRKASQQEFKNYANGIVILESLLSALYTFKLDKQYNWMLVPIFVLVVRWINHSSFFMRRRLTNKYYSLMLKLFHNGIASIKLLRLCCIRQFRNPQYPVDRKKLDRLLEKLRKFPQPGLTLASKKIEQRLELWNLNKSLRVKVIADLGFQQDRLFNQIINQDKIEQSVTVKELSVGYLDIIN